jgi:hypothetical protein
VYRHIVNKQFTIQTVYLFSILHTGHEKKNNIKPSPMKAKTIIIGAADEQKYQFQLRLSSSFPPARNKTSLTPVFCLNILITFPPALYFVYVKTISNALK